MSAMDKVKAKVDNLIHPHGHSTAGTTSTTGTTHTTNTTHSGVPEGVAGPHGSRVANAADPRVDSDRDHRGNTAGHTGITGGATGTGYNSTGTTGTGYNSTGATTSTTAGPHNSNLLNKVDPRVDSDMDGSRNMGAAQHGAGATGTGVGYGSTGNSMGTTGAGYGSTHTGTHAGNHLGTSHGTTGGLSNSTNAGPHNSNLANKVDPRVDSDLDGRGNRHGAATGGILGTSGSHATPGSGTAQNTAGPHNSDMMNKMDPRVDADMDGSKTMGGNRTHA